MTDARPETKTEKTRPEQAKPEDRDAMLDGGQADYGSAGGLAQEGVNGATAPDDAVSDD